MRRAVRTLGHSVSPPASGFRCSDRSRGAGGRREVSHTRRCGPQARNSTLIASHGLLYIYTPNGMPTAPRIRRPGDDRAGPGRASHRRGGCSHARRRRYGRLLGDPRQSRQAHARPARHRRRGGRGVRCSAALCRDRCRPAAPSGWQAPHRAQRTLRLRVSQGGIQARLNRNPRTGERVEVPPKYVPHFKTGKELRELLVEQSRSGAPARPPEAPLSPP